MLDLGSAFKQLRISAGNVFIGVLVIAGSGTVMYIKLDRLYDAEDFLVPAAGLTIVGVVGRYVVVRIRQPIQDVLEDRGWTLTAITDRAIKKFFKQEVEAPAPFDWIEYVTAEFAPGTRRKYDLPVGLDANGKMVHNAMRYANAHLMINGRPGSGKSALVAQMIVAAASSGLYQIVIVCRTDKDYKTVADMRNVHIVKFNDPSLSIVENRNNYAEALPTILDDITSEMGRRQDYLAKHDVSDWDELTSTRRADRRPKRIIVVIEEYGNAALGMKHADKNEFFHKTLLLAQEARATGISMLLLVQRADAKTVSTSIRSAMSSITYKTRDATDARIGTGVNDSGAEKLRHLDKDNKIAPEFIFAAAEDVYRLSSPWADKIDTRKAAMAHEPNLKFAGYPHWLSAWTGSTTSREGVAENQAETAVSDTIPLAAAAPHLRVMQVVDQPVPTPIISQSSRVEPEIVPNPVGTEVGTGTVGTPPLRPTTIMKFVERLFNRHTDFQGLGPAYTLARTKAIFMLLTVPKMGNNEIQFAIFNNKGRYGAYVNTCRKHYARLCEAWEMKHAAALARS